MSEVMLQQTQAARAAPAFEAFITRFPDVRSLAGASLADVLRTWGRLGYPRRAVALHRAAGEIAERHGGRVPSDPATLRALPGVGEYTAAAVASLAYGRPVAALDTNARRVWARVDHGAEPDEIPARTLADTATAWLDLRRPSEWNQALMDLGRDVCRPRPRCEMCPLRPWCAFARAGRLGRPATRRQPRYEGSVRQVRGQVLAALRERSPMSVAALKRVCAPQQDRFLPAVRGLHEDGLVEASSSALAGQDLGLVTLPR